MRIENGEAEDQKTLIGRFVRDKYKGFSVKRKKERIFFIVMIGLELAIVSGLLFGFYAWRGRSRTEKVQIIYDRPLYRDDPVLGFGCIGGVHRLILRYRNGDERRDWQFTVSLDEQGYRTTADFQNGYAGKREVDVYGCSMTWGWPLDNRDTFPWIVQGELPDYCVNNLAQNGYGTLHALLQLRQRLAAGKRPSAVVIVYNSFHICRNLPTPSRLADYGFARPEVRNFHHATARLDNNGHLVFGIIPLRSIPGPDPSLQYQREVTKAILMEIKRLCEDAGIVPVLAVQSGPPDDLIVRFGESIGFRIVDMSVRLTDDLTCLPIDPHPNAKAHRIYAQKLSTGLKHVLTNAPNILR